MKFYSLFRVELGRLFKSRLTWAVLCFTLAAPAAGLTIYTPLSGSHNSTALANPALGGALAGALLLRCSPCWNWTASIAAALMCLRNPWFCL